MIVIDTLKITKISFNSLTAVNNTISNRSYLCIIHCIIYNRKALESFVWNWNALPFTRLLYAIINICNYFWALPCQNIIMTWFQLVCHLSFILICCHSAWWTYFIGLWWRITHNIHTSIPKHYLYYSPLYYCYLSEHSREWQRYSGFSYCIWDTFHCRHIICTLFTLPKLLSLSTRNKV